MRTHQFVIFLFIVSVLSSGCLWRAITTGTGSGPSDFQFIANWNELEALSRQELSALAVDLNRPPTHVGLRLEYQDKSRLFVESIERALGEEEDILLIPNIPEGTVRVIFAVVHKGDSEQYGSSVVLWYGVLPDLRVTNGTIARVTVDNIRERGVWIRPDWEIVNPEVAAIYELGTSFRRVDCPECFDEERGVFWLHIRSANPLAYEGRNPAYGPAEIMVGIGRTSSVQ